MAERPSGPGAIVTPRLLLPLGLLLAIAVGVSLRVAMRAQLDDGDRVRPLDSDSAYHLRRARFAAAHFPRTVLFDPLMNFPDGGVPIWPPLFDLALAAPARIAHGADATPGQVETGAAWVPVALAAAAIALAGLAARVPFGDAGGVAAAFFVAICPAHILWTQWGHTDQHVAESATGLLVLWLFLASRKGDEGADPRADGRQARSEAFAGGALALAVLSWQGAIYWGALLALAIFLEAVLFRRRALRPALLLLLLPAAVTAAATAAWLGPLRPPVTYISFGFFQPLFLAALAAGTVALETLVALRRRSLPKRALLQRLIFVAAALVLLLPFWGELSRGLVRGVGYVLGKTTEAPGSGGYASYPAGWLHGIFETRPLLADGPGLALRQLSGAFLLSPLVLAAWAIRARRGPERRMHLALLLWGLVTLFLALSQRLNVYYAAPLAAFCLIEVVRFVRSGLAASEGPLRLVPAAAVGAAAAILLVPTAAGLRHELTAVRAPGSDLFDTLDWMKTHLPRTVDAYDARLLDHPAGPPELASAESVLAPWSLGHFLLYRAELPVAANNFGYGFLDSVRFFLAEDEREALKIAERHRARWVVATDLVPRMNDYAGYLGRPPYLEAAGSGLRPKASYFATMQSRLYDFDGAASEASGAQVPALTRFRLVYHSKSAIRRGQRWLARWKVFEVLPP
jgi:asparagine N-glycosylation enzyme membrane subunit Stt3